MLNQLKITVIGGGTGSYALLTGLKHLTPNLTALVNMSDDGGSTGKLRDELGVLPPGDIRQCLVALSKRSDARSLFNYRFGEGSLAGHSLGNIILSGLELMHQDFSKAVKVVGSMLDISGQVIPITLDKHQLVLEDSEQAVKGQYNIGHAKISPTAKIKLEPNAVLNPEARQAIDQSDLVVIAPGNLYGSLLPALSVSGVKQALKRTKAQTVAISNLVTKPGQTDSWHVVDYIKKIEEYTGQNLIDAVLYNNVLPTKELLSKYAADGEHPVATEPARFSETKSLAKGGPLISDSVFTQDANDKAIKRTLIRHDGKKVGAALADLYQELKNSSGNA